MENGLRRVCGDDASEALSTSTDVREAASGVLAKSRRAVSTVESLVGGGSEVRRRVLLVSERFVELLAAAGGAALTGVVASRDCLRVALGSLVAVASDELGKLSRWCTGAGRFCAGDDGADGGGGGWSRGWRTKRAGRAGGSADAGPGIAGLAGDGNGGGSDCRRGPATSGERASRAVATDPTDVLRSGSALARASNWPTMSLTAIGTEQRQVTPAPVAFCRLEARRIRQCDS